MFYNLIHSIAGCYCYSLLKNEMEANGLFNALSNLQSSDGDVCKSWFNDYITSKVLSILSGLVITIINMFLSFSLAFLTEHEKHKNSSSLESSTTLKIFRYFCLLFRLLVDHGPHSLKHYLNLIKCSILQHCNYKYGCEGFIIVFFEWWKEIRPKRSVVYNNCSWKA